jgi:AraC-like DNA-binding protein
MGAADLDRAVTSEVRVRRWRYDGAARWWPAGTHGELEVAWVGEGALAYSIGRREVEVPAGSMMVLRYGIEHATRMSSGLRAGSVWLGSEMVAAVAAAVGCGPAPDPMVIPAAPRLVALGEMLQAEAANDDPGATLAVEALSEAFAVGLIRSFGGPATTRARDPRIGLAIDRIRSSYGEPLSVGDLARSAGMSRYHFSRVFCDHVGSSPYRYLQDTRVERAAELLRSGRRSVTEVALTVGFQDLGRFGRAFRRRFGCAPSELAPRGARSAERSARSA